MALAHLAPDLAEAREPHRLMVKHIRAIDIPSNGKNLRLQTKYRVRVTKKHNVDFKSC